MKRIYHPIDCWEEIHFNMWGASNNKVRDLENAICFTGNHRLYGRYMRRVTREWPMSCENALTDIRMNRRAWLGHAAVALALQIPEDIVRNAWGYLTERQRELANREADRAIRQWEQQNYPTTDADLHQPVEKQMLLFGHTGFSTGQNNRSKASA